MPWSQTSRRNNHDVDENRTMRCQSKSSDRNKSTAQSQRHHRRSRSTGPDPETGERRARIEDPASRRDRI